MDLHIQPPLPEKRDFRIGILGSGFVVNECHLPAYRKAGFNPVAIASRSRQKAEQTAQRHGIPKVYDSYDDLLNDPSIEVLDIAVPPQAQHDLIQRACARKTVRGILAQKPLGVNYEEAVDAAGLCRQAGIVLSVNQNMRYDQSVRAAKTLLQNGVIGMPIFATIEMRGIPHWMPWQAELDWLTLRIMSIHHLDCFRYWFGDPQGVYCSTREDPRTEFRHLDGICTYILEYADGLRCVGIDDTWTGPAKEGCPSDNYLRWRIEGLNGLAIGDIGWCRDPYTTPSTIKYAAKGDQGFHEPKWTESWFPDAFIGTMAQLLIALETGTEPANTAADNLKTMALVEAAYASAQRFTSINLEDFKFQRKVGATEIKKPGLFSKLFSKTSASASGPLQEEPMNNFTPRAQQALALARKEADRFNHNFVGTEHLLLGLIALGQGVAITVLAKLGLHLENVRKEIEKQVGTGPDQKMVGNIPYTPRVKKVLALACKEARNLNHTYVGTEHILLGLLREGDGVAARVLTSLDINVEETRKEILRELDPNFGTAPRRFVANDPNKHESFSQVVSSPTESANPLASEFTPRAQQVLALARREAERLNLSFVGSEHLLFGIIELGNGVAWGVLANLGLDLEKVRAEVAKLAGPGAVPRQVPGRFPYDPRVKRVLAAASREAKNLDHAYIDTEHILLGLLKTKESVIGEVFISLNIDVEKTRLEILRQIVLNVRDEPRRFSAIQSEQPGFFSRVVSEMTGSAQRLNNFTPRAQQVLALARKEADRFNHSFVGTEHLLLGLIALNQGVALSVLRKLGLNLENVRLEVEKQVGTGPDQKMIGNIPYTPRVKKVLALAAKEANNLHHVYIGTEHILLGLLREEDGVAARVLKNLGVDVEKTRLEILNELNPNFGQ
jgi:predicted dehydrogenase